MPCRPAWAKRPSILPVLWFVILGVTIALLAGMTFLVVAETFIPSGSTPGPLYLARGRATAWAGPSAARR